jgi:EAL domain-containing protein (putative c-di-GMP-specific phosphodiesterase class I)
MHLIESADLEIQIGEFVIHESLKQANTWYANGMTIEMSINIAAKPCNPGILSRNYKTC